LDITGGAPELNPSFRYLVKQAKVLRCHVIVRTNLTIFLLAEMDDLPQFFSDNMVEVIASLPYYEEDCVDHVRGKGMFKKSIEALRQLNDLGYGKDSKNLQLNLVFNPHDGSFPPHLSQIWRKNTERYLGPSMELPLTGFLQLLICPLDGFVKVSSGIMS
jgi:radical SAM/Cys-rich protein